MEYNCFFEVRKMNGSYRKNPGRDWKAAVNSVEHSIFIVPCFRPLRLLFVHPLYEENSRDSLEKMDEVVEDEKKPFDAEIGADEDSQPDPEEQLMLDQGNGRVWLVKVSQYPRRPGFYLPRTIGSKIPNGTLGVYQRGGRTFGFHSHLPPSC